MKDLSQKFRGSLPANTRKKEGPHPDFTAKLTIWNTVYSAAAWFGTTKKGDTYISLHLSSDGESQSEKIKLALWRNHDHQAAADPHFQSTQSIYGHDFALKAWFVSSDGDNHRLGVTIDPIDTDGAEISDAALETRKRIASFLAEVSGEVALPPAPKAVARLHASTEDRETDDIPF